MVTLESTILKWSSMANHRLVCLRWKTATHSGDKQENASQSAYLTICGLAVTLAFDLYSQNVISLSLSPTAPKLYIWGNSHKWFVRDCINTLLVYDHGCMGSPKTEGLWHHSNGDEGTKIYAKQKLSA